MRKIKLTAKQKYDLGVKMAKKLVKEFNDIHRKELMKIDSHPDSMIESHDYVNLILNTLNKFIGSVFLDLSDFFKQQNNKDIQVLELITLFHVGLYNDIEKYLNREKLN